MTYDVILYINATFRVAVEAHDDEDAEIIAEKLLTQSIDSDVEYEVNDATAFKSSDQPIQDPEDFD